MNKEFLFNLYIHACRMLFGVKSKKVVFTSFSGKSYSDNPKAVSECLHSIMPEAEIYWFFSEPETKKDVVPSYVHLIGNNYRKFFRHLATASVFVTNNSLNKIPKSKKQMFIQVWHGDKAFKTILLDSPNVTPDFHVPEQEEGYCDLAVAGSEYGKHQFESAFGYRGKILMEGTPRNDLLLKMDQEVHARIKKNLNFSDQTKLLLYAPTLRRAAQRAGELQKVQDLQLSKLLDLLEKRDGCEWRCLLRAHPSVVGLGGAEKDPRIVDLTTYEDMADLLLISDLLITDYSSCAGDFALTNRPVILYQSDRREYLDKDRTFYFDIDESPYLVAENQEQLEQIISSLTKEKVEQNCLDILKFYGDCETGKASLAVSNIIKDWLENKPWRKNEKSNYLRNL